MNTPVSRHPFPWFLILIAIYPVISLYSVNLSEVNVLHIIRPLLVAVIFLPGIWLIIGFITKKWQLSAVLIATVYLFLAIYGVIYLSLRGLNISGLIIGRHRVLFIAVSVLIVVVCLLLIRLFRKYPKGIWQGMTVIGLALLIMPIFQIVTGINKIKLPSLNSKPAQSIVQTSTVDKPDIYYFVLDSYAREDYIRKYMNYDNSGFIAFLREKGFYVADCSLSNYSFTRLSLTASLNMSYLEDLGESFLASDTDETRLDPYVLHSKVRTDLEAAGYQTVAFKTGYPFTEMTDADVYLQPNPNPLLMSVLSPFEVLLFDNSALSVFSGYPSIRKLFGLDFPYYERYDNQKFIINKIPEVPDLPGSKFVFVHLVTTHRPYIFKSDGSIQTDPRYYQNDGVAVSDDLYIRGYQNSLDFTNNYMEELITTILQRSSKPPIIIIQGDHGVRPPGRDSILNAIYMPSAKDRFYPSITPVNTFRLVLNQVLGQDNQLLPDHSFFSNVNKAPYDFSETEHPSQDCIIQ